MIEVRKDMLDTRKYGQMSVWRVSSFDWVGFQHKF